MDEQPKPKKKKKKRKNSRKDKSVGWVITMAMILIGYIGWGLMAGYYASHVEGFGSSENDPAAPTGRYVVRGELQARTLASLMIGVVAFVVNSFKQIPNLFNVLGYCFKNVPGMPITIIVLEGLTFMGGFWMKKVDNELSKPAQRKPRQEIRLPKD